MMRFGALCVFAALLSGQALGQGATAQPEWINALRAGGHVIVIRHGATFADQADTDPLEYFERRQAASAQRQRPHARALDRRLDAQAEDPGRSGHHADQFNRAVETGTLLGFGAVTIDPDITEGGLVVTPNENNRRAQAMRKLAATVPPAGSNTVIVSHKPNIMDAFGKDWFEVKEGEASIFKPDGNGFKPVARVQAEEWAKLAQ